MSLWNTFSLANTNECAAKRSTELCFLGNKISKIAFVFREFVYVKAWDGKEVEDKENIPNTAVADSENKGSCGCRKLKGGTPN